MSTSKIRIAWRSKITGATGHGEYIFTSVEAVKHSLQTPEQKWGHIIDHWWEEKP